MSGKEISSCLVKEVNSSILTCSRRQLNGGYVPVSSYFGVGGGISFAGSR